MSVDRRDAIRAVFDRIAPDYDASGVPFFAPIAELVVDAVDPQPGEDGLDAGCGRGAALIPLARRVAPGGSATGIDLSPRMVELAAVAAADAGIEVEVRVDDAQTPTFPPASFDVVVASLVVFFLPDPAVALHNWRALLRPAGRLGFTTFGPYSDHWKTVDAVFAPYLQSAAPAGARSDVPDPFATIESTEELTRAAGFTRVRTTVTALEVSFDSPAQWEAWTRGQGQAVRWQSVPDAELDEVRRRAYAAVDASRDAQGRIAFEQQIRTTVGQVP